MDAEVYISFAMRIVGMFCGPDLCSHFHHAVM